MKTIKIFLIVAFLTGAVGWFALQNTEASDYQNSRHPMFKDVKKVYIYVSYHEGLTKEDQEKYSIPEHIKKENIEKKLITMFDARFSSEKCKHASEYGLRRNFNYGCDNQPVQLLTDKEYLSFASFDRGEEIKEPGSLFVIMKVNITGAFPNQHDPLFQDPIVSYVMTLSRPADKMFMDSYPQAYPITQKDETIDKLLTKYIAGRIAQ
jgi:hypothetical protein